MPAFTLSVPTLLARNSSQRATVMAVNAAAGWGGGGLHGIMITGGWRPVAAYPAWEVVDKISGCVSKVRALS